MERPVLGCGFPRIPSDRDGEVGGCFSNHLRYSDAIDGLPGAAAFVLNAHLDIPAANERGYALYSDMFSRATGPDPVNRAR